MLRAIRMLGVKPFLLLVPMLAFLIIYLGFVFNPVTTFFSQLSGQAEVPSDWNQHLSTILSTYISMFHIVVSPQLLSPFVIGLLTILLLFISVFIAFYLSGFLGQVKYSLLENKVKISDLCRYFGRGVWNFYLRQFVVTFLFAVVVLMISIVIAFSGLPAAFFTYSVISGEMNYQGAMIAINIITVIFVTTGIIYILTYMLSVTSAIYFNSKLYKCINAAKAFREEHFWKIFGNLFLLLIALLVFFTITGMIKASISNVVPMEGFSFGALLFFIINVGFGGFVLAVGGIYIISEYNTTLEDHSML